VRSVFSVTGAEINLADATTESLAEVVDGMNEEISKLTEARQLVFRELAKRMTTGRLTTDDWVLAYKPYVHVVRKRKYGD
jgi:hypothetical protein